LSSKPARSATRDTSLGSIPGANSATDEGQSGVGAATPPPSRQHTAPLATTVVYVVGHRDSPNPSDTELEDRFSPAPIAGYARVDVALGYHFGGQLSPLSMTASERNLLNRDYAQSIGFPAPPANFLAGLRYGF